LAGIINHHRVTPPYLLAYDTEGIGLMRKHLIAGLVVAALLVASVGAQDAAFPEDEDE